MKMVWMRMCGIKSGDIFHPDPGGVNHHPRPRFHLPAGKQVLTLHFLDQQVFDFDYMEFVKVAAP